MNPLLTLPASELKTALVGLAKVVGRPSLPVLNSVRLERTPPGQVSLWATDLEDHLQYRFSKAQPGPAFSHLLPWDRFTSTVKGLSAKDTMQVALEGKTSVRLRVPIGESQAEHKLETLPLNEWPPLPVVKGTAITLETSFGEAVQQAFACASEDETRYVLNGVYLDVSKPNCHCVVATNGRVLYAANSFVFALPRGVILPRRRIYQWSRLWTAEHYTLRVNSDKEQPWLQLDAGPWSLLSKSVDGTYPNWRQVLHGTGSERVTVTFTPEAMTQALRILERLPGANAFNSAVRLRFSDPHLFLEGRNAEADDWTSVPVTGATVLGGIPPISVNREYLKLPLRFGIHRFTGMDERSPLQFDANGRQFILMPVRFDAPPVPIPSPTPPPTAAATVPSPSGNGAATHPTDTPMPPTTTTLTPPERGNLKTHPTNGETSSALKEILDHLERIKLNLRDVISDLGETAELIKTAEKERKITLREMNSVRSTLRSLQKVEL